MDRLSQRISVIVPCYNEGSQIYRNLAEICEFLDQFAPDYDLIVVDDGSGDDSLSEIQRATTVYPRIRNVHYEENIGKGNALREGFRRASGEYVVFLDADLDLHPRQLARFFEIQRRENADIVIGSKRHPDSRVDYPRRRRVISFAYSLILRILFDLPVRDTQAGLKLFRREALEKVFSKIVCKRFAFDVEVLANAHQWGYRIVEAPIELNFSRVLRRGRMTPADLWNTGWDTLAIYYRTRVHYYERAHLLPSEFPPVTVIVCAMGTEAGLKECVAGCIRQDYPSPVEVLLVANETPSLEGHGKLRMIKFPGTDHAAKRKLGAKESRFDLVAFLDAPAIPARDWLSRAARNFGDSEIAAVSGPRLADSNSSAVPLSGLRRLAALFGEDSLRYRYFSRVNSREKRCFVDHLIVRRSVLDSIPESSTTSELFEGSALARRMTGDMKLLIAYDPEAIVYRSG